MTEASLKQSVIKTYRKRAGCYDFTSSLYRLIGFRIEAYRRRAVSALSTQQKAEREGSEWSCLNVSWQVSAQS